MTQKERGAVGRLVTFGSKKQSNASKSWLAKLKSVEGQVNSKSESSILDEAKVQLSSSQDVETFNKRKSNQKNRVFGQNLTNFTHVGTSKETVSKKQKVKNKEKLLKTHIRSSTTKLLPQSSLNASTNTVSTAIPSTPVKLKAKRNIRNQEHPKLKVYQDEEPPPQKSIDLLFCNDTPSNSTNVWSLPKLKSPVSATRSIDSPKPLKTKKVLPSFVGSPVRKPRFMLEPDILGIITRQEESESEEVPSTRQEDIESEDEILSGIATFCQMGIRRNTYTHSLSDMSGYSIKHSIALSQTSEDDLTKS